MPNGPPVAQPVPPRRWRWVRAAAWTLGVLAVLAGLAAALLPGYLKGVAIDQIREQLHREARIESIAVNPLLLSARIRGLAIAQADGKSELFGFDELHIRLGVSSLFRRAPIIDELRIERPRLHLSRLAPERYNVSDIVELLLAKPSDPEGPRFELNSVAVKNASVTFDDRPTGKQHKIDHVDILLPALSSFDDDRGAFAEPVLTGSVNGQPLHLKGRTKPFDTSLETTVELNFVNLDVPTYLAYSPVPLPLRLDRGRLTTAIQVAFLRAKDRGVSISVKGTVKVDDIVLQDPAAPAGAPPIATVRSVDARIAELRWPENSIRLDQVAIAAPQVILRRDKAGQLNWQELLARGTTAATPTVGVSSGATPIAARPVAPTVAPVVVAVPAPAVAPDKSGAVQFSIAVAQITEGGVVFDDFAAPEAPFHAVGTAITIRARGLSNAEGAQATIDSSLVTDAGEMHANSATLMLKPFGVTGEVSVKQIRLGRFKPYFGGVLVGDIDGTADVHARYAVDADYNVKVSDASLAVAGFALRDKARTEFARIGGLAVTGAEFDLDQRSIAIGGVALRQCRAALARDADGAWNFASLIKTASPGPAAAPASTIKATGQAAPAPPGAAAAPVQEWSVALKQASLERCVIQLDDRSASRSGAARIVLDPIDARLDGWSSKPKARGRVEIKTRVNGAGQIALRGTAGIAPPGADVDVDVDGLDLVPLQLYVADRLNIRLTSGNVSTRGKLSVAAADVFTARYLGDAALLKVASTTRADGEDFLNWGSLQLRGVDIGLNAPAASGGAPVPLAVALEELALTDFYSRLILNADSTLNVQQVVADSGPPPAPATPPAPESSAANAPTRATAPPPVTIARVTLRNGRINFSDRFIKPSYSANLAEVNGVVAGLSSDFASRASVDIAARYDPSALVAIKGTINPLRGNLYLDLTASCRDVELVPLSPYAQKYAGYGITKGKLSFQVKYLIEDRKLTAANSLRLDQLTFGDKVESPDATKLPVLFAVSLLKNAKGEIDIDLPVSGSLDDPQFSVFGIVGKIIVNLLVKAATSPFALLGALAGGGEDLAYADFPAGGATTFAPGQDEKLNKIAKALGDRPALRLDIAGRVDSEADGPALHQRALLRKLAALRQEEQLAKGEATASAETMTIAPADYPRLLKRAFDNEKFAKPRNAPGTAADLSVADMEKLMLANIVVSPDELRELGERRARTAKEALAKAGIAGERMFIVAVTEASAETAAPKRGPRVDFVLK